jgi:cytochrome c oxidase subunit 3
LLLVGALCLLLMLGWFGDVIGENQQGCYRQQETCRFAGAWAGSFFPK